MSQDTSKSNPPAAKPGAAPPAKKPRPVDLASESVAGEEDPGAALDEVPEASEPVPRPTPRP